MERMMKAELSTNSFINSFKCMTTIDKMMR